MKPTDEQLRDPKWWDENAPMGATHFDKDRSMWIMQISHSAWCWDGGWQQYKNQERFEWHMPNAQSRPTKPAAPEIMSDDCLAAKIGEIGNQIHNLGCDKQNDEGLSDRLGELAIALWDLAKRAPADSAAPEWDGEGLPPVGEEVEAVFVSGSMNQCWSKGKVVAYDNGLPVIRVGGVYYGLNLDRLRPIRTKEQRERDEIESIIHDCSYDALDSASAIIAAGYRKGDL